jgi:hypothetical protein
MEPSMTKLIAATFALLILGESVALAQQQEDIELAKVGSLMIWLLRCEPDYNEKTLCLC